jgi:hypothetical protein
MLFSRKIIALRHFPIEPFENACVCMKLKSNHDESHKVSRDSNANYAIPVSDLSILRKANLMNHYMLETIEH